MASAGFRDYVREAKGETGLSYRAMARRAQVKESRMSEFMSRPKANLSAAEEERLRRVIEDARRSDQGVSEPDGRIAEIRAELEEVQQSLRDLPVIRAQLARIEDLLLGREEPPQQHQA